MRRYGQLIADEARTREGLQVTEVEAGRVDQSSEQLARVADELSGCDVVLMQWNKRGWGKHGRALPRLMRFRRSYKGALVVTMHDVFDRHGFRARYAHPDVWSLRQLGRTADRIVVHSQIEVERLRGIIPIEKMRVVPHFVESRELPMSPEEARARLGLGDRRLVTLLGFVYGRKGHRYAVEAVPYMPDDAIMVYAGGPIEGRTFVYDLARQKAEELELGDRFPHHRLPQRGRDGHLDGSHAPGHPALHRPLGIGLDVLVDLVRQAHARVRPARHPRVRAAHARRTPLLRAGGRALAAGRGHQRAACEALA